MWPKIAPILTCTSEASRGGLTLISMEPRPQREYCALDTVFVIADNTCRQTRTNYCIWQFSGRNSHRMSFTQAISSAFRHYAKFSGRASRSEYWWFVLFQFVIGLLLILILPVLYYLFFVATILPYLAVLVRRLHDTGRSGWWVFVGLIPFGGLVLPIFALLEGNRGRNEYGPNPIHPPSELVDEGGDARNIPGRHQRPCRQCGSNLIRSAKFCGKCGRQR